MSDTTPVHTVFRPEQIDLVADAVIALTREVWVLTDRQRVLEAVLTKHGINAAAEIDAFTPDPAMEAALTAKRDRLIGAVTKALSGAPPETVAKKP